MVQHVIKEAEEGSSIPDFRSRLMRGDVLMGSFIKTPTGHNVEILGTLGFDFVVIDEEHAPFDKRSIDEAILAARSTQAAAFVRVATSHPSNILSVLDCGATGVLVPHVISGLMARDVALAARYKGGRRGFSGSPRAGGYGSIPTWEHVANQDLKTTVIVQIEDLEALSDLDAIAATDGIDALFIGRGDLTVAMGAASGDDDVIREACVNVVRAARNVNKPVAAFANSAQEVVWLLDLGVSAFIYSSDQGLMRSAALETLLQVKKIKCRIRGRNKPGV